MRNGATPITASGPVRKRRATGPALFARAPLSLTSACRAESANRGGPLLLHRGRSRRHFSWGRDRRRLGERRDGSLGGLAHGPVLGHRREGARDCPALGPHVLAL